MDMKPLGKKIKAFRKKHHLTQDGFALRVHMSPSSVSRFERGANRNPGIETLEAMAKNVNMSLQEFLFDPQAREGRLIEVDLLKEEDPGYYKFLLFTRALDGLPKDQREAFTTLLKLLVHVFLPGIEPELFPELQRGGGRGYG